MRLLTLFRKTLIENVRDWKILILGLTFAPFFVVLMYFYMTEGTTVYRVVVINRDEGETGKALVAQLTSVQVSGGAAVLEVRQEDDLALATERLREKRADLVVEIPRDFSAVLQAYRNGARPAPAVVRTIGDPGNVKSVMAAAMTDYLVYEYAAAMANEPGPLVLDAQAVGGARSLNEFDLYVPALLALALMMLMFTAAASLIKEKDKGTLLRLRLSSMTTFEWLTALSAVQVLIGLLAFGITYGTAVALGYRGSGTVVALTVVGALSSLAVIAISIVVAAWLQTIFDLMTIGCFPFFVLMFFSGGMFPIPDVRLFTLGDRAVNLNEVLPTTHSIAALGKILNAGAGLGDLTYELTAMVLLTAALFAVGTWLFTRRHMRAR